MNELGNMCTSANNLIKTMANMPSLLPLQQYPEIYPTLNSVFNGLNEEYAKIYELNVHLTHIFTAIEKLSVANYVYWDKLPIDLAKKLSLSDDTNKILEDYETQTGGKNTEEIFTMCQNFLSAKKHKILLSQTFSAYSNKQYDLAILGLFAMIDWSLARTVTEIEQNKIQLQERYKKLLEKLKKEKLSNEECSIITFMKTFASAEETFVAFSNFSGTEPNYPNRHWAMHGRSTHLNTKLDYIKILRFMGGIVKIDDLIKNSLH